MNYANQLGYSDITPYEIVRRISGKTVEIREMNSERDPTWKPEFVVGGYAGHCTNQHMQRWIITPDLSASVRRIRLSKTGVWKDAYGHKYELSETPRRFYDYNF